MKKFLLAAILYIFPLFLFAATDTAVFAGGCFWCMEPPYDKLEGVVSTTSGYSGGHTEHPTYKAVSAGTTGHYEVIQIEYDPAMISYEKLTDVFWKNIDPFDAGGQFCDRGPQYRAAIFTKNDEERELALRSKEALQEKLGDKATIVIDVLPAETFYAAEDYHQDYYQKNPIRYKYYRHSCGRDRRLQQIDGIVNSEN